MINFSGLQNNFGKFLRFVLSFLPPMTVPVLQGSARGKLWRTESGLRGFWLGSYEAKKQKLFSKIVKKGDVVYDIGANAGFYTVVACSLGAKAYSFEPEIKNYNYLCWHISKNKLDAVPFNIAVSNFDGAGKFSTDEDLFSNHVSDRGRDVICRSIDSLVENSEIEYPNVVKIDVEGEEKNVLLGMKNVIKKSHPVIFIEIHKIGDPDGIISFMEKNGYSTEKIKNGEYKFA